MPEKRRWKDLSPAARVGIVVLAIVQLLLLGAAQNDLRKRPAAQVRGPKALWRAFSFVNFVGPITYFVVGRKPA